MKTTKIIKAQNHHKKALIFPKESVFIIFRHSKKLQFLFKLKCFMQISEHETIKLKNQEHTTEIYSFIYSFRVSSREIVPLIYKGSHSDPQLINLFISRKFAKYLQSKVSVVCSVCFDSTSIISFC